MDAFGGQAAYQSAAGLVDRQDIPQEEVDRLAGRHVLIAAGPDLLDVAAREFPVDGDDRARPILGLTHPERCTRDWLCVTTRLKAVGSRRDLLQVQDACRGFVLTVVSRHADEVLEAELLKLGGSDVPERPFTVELVERVLDLGIYRIGPGAESGSATTSVNGWWSGLLDGVRSTVTISPGRCAYGRSLRPHGPWTGRLCVAAVRGVPAQRKRSAMFITEAVSAIRVRLPRTVDDV